MNFLPEYYEAPKGTNQLYFKLEEGENRIRILSKPVFGWEDWTLEKKPIRFRMNEKPAKPIDPKKAIKHFWAFIVWNVKDEKIQIMQVTQATIRKRIEELCKDEEWGFPYEYDIKISKSGQGIDTEYSVNPTRPTPVTNEIIAAFRERPINLEALFINADPFSTEWKEYTKLMPEAEDAKIQPINQLMGEKVDVKPLYISMDQAIELSEILNGCSDISIKNFKDFMKNELKISGLEELPLLKYQNIKSRLEESYKDNQKAALEAEMANKKGK